MDQSFKVMTKTLKQFKVATESKDWDAVSTLDTEFRAELENAMSLVSNDTNASKLVSFLERANSIYELVKSGAEKNRDEITEELRQLSKDQRAAASYEQSARLR